jgi:hypothetical protein
MSLFVILVVIPGILLAMCHAWIQPPHQRSAQDSVPYEEVVPIPLPKWRCNISFHCAFTGLDDPQLDP